MIKTDEKHHTVTINGLRHTASVEARKLLVHMLRDDLGFTGTHVGCDASQCGLHPRYRWTGRQILYGSRGDGGWIDLPTEVTRDRDLLQMGGAVLDDRDMQAV